MLRSENKWQEALGIFLVLVGVTMRVLPHPDNFTPVTAIALFSGVVLAPQIALGLPLIVMIASDLILGPHALYPLTWGSFFLVSLLGVAIRKDARISRIFLGTLGGSLLFYLVTNLGVFLFQAMYEKSLSGLVQCYVMALPFFRNSLLGDLFFSGLFFGVFALVKNYSGKLVPRRTR
ncbi:MAG: hypothetical protein AUJ71_01555 [Candidatus Omnitrophica bacterium CG1_02_49_16]|nr:MAG: hypothetical protein AUJ71_01555 [Candidatus Omnitrophica bacterium CG1_02_49_16]